MPVTDPNWKMKNRKKYAGTGRKHIEMCIRGTFNFFLGCIKSDKMDVCSHMAPSVGLLRGVRRQVDSPPASPTAHSTAACRRHLQVCRRLMHWMFGNRTSRHRLPARLPRGPLLQIPTTMTPWQLPQPDCRESIPHLKFLIKLVRLLKCAHRRLPSDTRGVIQ